MFKFQYTQTSLFCNFTFSKEQKNTRTQLGGRWVGGWYLIVILPVLARSCQYMIIQTLEETGSNIEEEKANIQGSNEAEKKELKEPIVEAEEVQAPSIDPPEQITS